MKKSVESARSKGLVESRPDSRRLFQISTGLGAGNIGDEMMARAFWNQLPPAIQMDVEIFPGYSSHRDSYPPQYRYIDIVKGGAQAAAVAGIPGLMVGGTLVTETESLDWPLRFLMERLNCFHLVGVPVDAIGIGVDRLYTRRAREIFAHSFLPIRSWTVRTERCREALLDLGVPDDRIVTGADWAWLYKSRQSLRDWATEILTLAGAGFARPLIMVNAVNLVWKSKSTNKQALAIALDTLSGEHGFQIAFFCNECREGAMFDHAAALEIQSIMKAPSIVIPPRYWSSDEALAILSHASIVISQRYHATIMALLAGTLPVSIVRGHKMRGLLEELEMTASCTIDHVDPGSLVSEVLNAHSSRELLLSRAMLARRKLETRAGNNLRFFHSFYSVHR